MSSLVPSTLRLKQWNGVRPLGAAWHERLLTLWVEDDACRAAYDATREHVEEAFERITGFKPEKKKIVAEHHEDDFWVDLYPNGWWLAHSPHADEMGCVVEVRL